MYEIGLNKVAELALPCAPNSNEDKYEVFQNYEVEVNNAADREPLRSYLSKQGIGTILQWGGKAVHEFDGLGFKTSLTESYEKKFLHLNTSLKINKLNMY